MRGKCNLFYETVCPGLNGRINSFVQLASTSNWTSHGRERKRSVSNGIASCIMLFIMMLSSVVAFGNITEIPRGSPAEKTLAEIKKCINKSQQEIWDEDSEKRIGVLAQCKDYDFMGGQPIVAPDIVKKAKEWSLVAVPKTPLHYKKKCITNRDYTGLYLQNEIINQVNEYRDTLIYVATQYDVLKLPVARIKEIEKAGAALMTMKSWKVLCEVDSRNAINSAKALGKQFAELTEQMSEALNEILVAKKMLYSQYAMSEPQKAQTATAIITAKRMQKRQEQKRLEEEKANLFEMVCDAAAADEAEANRGGDNGRRLQSEQFRNDEVARRALHKALKDAKKGLRKPLSNEELNAIGTPAVAH